MALKYQNKKRGSTKILSVVLTVIVASALAVGVTYAVKGYLESKEEGGESKAMSLSEAIEIAENSECVNEGILTDKSMYNESTKTWWIDLEMDKPGCAPACVVKEADKTSEINWRCMGLITE